MLVTITAIAISGIYMSMILTQPVTENIIMESKQWTSHPLGDADPGAGNTGFMYIMVYPHQADPGTAYASNLSSGNAYEYSDSTNCELTGETPHSTAVDFVMKVRVNNTDGYNASGTTWEDSWVRANMTIDFDFLGDESDTAMTEQEIATAGTTYKFYNYYLNNAGSGYTLSKGETFNITSATFDVWE